MNPNESFIKTYRLRLQQISSIIETDFSHLSEDQLNWKPAPNSWSVAQCLRHLILASEGYVSGMEKAIKNYADEKMFKPYKSTLSGKIMFFMVDPSIKLWVPAPPKFKPDMEERFTTEIINSYRKLINAVAEKLEEAKELDWNKMKITSPVTSLLVFNMGDVFEVLTLHSARHIKQAQKVISNEAFPV
jgi:hypothetical protein